jgi:tRNA-splicing ligase RtcB (3'-phosphate/5'-hydroxy nucleic acid ligase)
VLHQQNQRHRRFKKNLIMGKLKLKPKQLSDLGFPQNPAISMTMSVMEKHYKHQTFDEVLPILRGLVSTPDKYYNDTLFSKIAEKIKPKPDTKPEELELLANPLIFNTFGMENIEKEAFAQMRTAMRLPITVAGALMPDAHAGYGLPIGGVLATEGAVIPYGVGVDIGCRMCLSVFPIDASEFSKRSKMLEKAIRENTIFGAGGAFGRAYEHAVIDSPLFHELPLLRDMQNKAAKQLGTSGSGNHFVEFGIVDFPNDDAALGVKAGKYIGLLSHSGSRALGATVANHYTQVAMKKRLLPREAKNLAWLNLTEQEGIEYWLAMNLAGDYAAACHDTIHRNIARAIDNQVITRIENHHNFAWKEVIDGREVIVHRKGATPADKGVMGIIPGSMTATGYIVRGKGEVSGINSAAHGAGRKMSRRRAKESVTHYAMKEMLEKHGVTLIGGGLDESPHAYKDIDVVMQSQRALVDVIGSFAPKIVRMDEN